MEQKRILRAVATSKRTKPTKCKFCVLEHLPTTCETMDCKTNTVYVWGNPPKKIIVDGKKAEISLESFEAISKILKEN